MFALFMFIVVAYVCNLYMHYWRLEMCDETVPRRRCGFEYHHKENNQPPYKTPPTRAVLVSPVKVREGHLT
jgi:hypothetical protein